jgi:hypothetical protein
MLPPGRARTLGGRAMSDDRQRRPEDLGGEYGFHVGPHDDADRTRWQVSLNGLWQIADEDRPFKAVAKLERFIAEAQEALTHLQSMGAYREDRPAHETPATGVPIHCPAQPCPWHTYWDTPEEAETAQQRHVDEEHGGDRSPSQEWQDEAFRRWRERQGSAFPLLPLLWTEGWNAR